MSIFDEYRKKNHLTAETPTKKYTNNRETNLFDKYRNEVVAKQRDTEDRANALSEMSKARSYGMTDNEYQTLKSKGEYYHSKGLAFADLSEEEQKNAQVEANKARVTNIIHDLYAEQGREDELPDMYKNRIEDLSDSAKYVNERTQNGKKDFTIHNMEQEEKYMWYSIPEDVRNDIVNGTNQEKVEEILKREGYTDRERDLLNSIAKQERSYREKNDLEAAQDEEMGSNPFYAMLAPAQQVGANLLSVVTAPKTLWDAYKASNDPYRVANPYEGTLQKYAYLGKRAGETIQETLAEGNAYEQFLGKAYGTTMSAVESGARVAISRGIGGLISRYLPFIPFETSTKFVSEGLMTAAVANDTVGEMIDKGVSPRKAVATAIFRGITEAATENVSLENMQMFSAQPIVGSKADFFRNLLKAGFTEGMEEVASDLINDIYDQLALYDYSDFKAFRDQYEAEMGHEVPYADALFAYQGVLADKLTESFLGGAASGIMMGTFSNYKGYRDVQNFRAAGENVSEADAERMYRLIVELDNEDVNSTMENFENPVADPAARGFMKNVLDKVSKNYVDFINKADSEEKLATIMENMNRTFDSIISEDVINAYNAKMTQFGKEGTTYEDFVKNRQNSRLTTFGDLAYGTGNDQSLTQYRESVEKLQDEFATKPQFMESIKKLAEAREQVEQKVIDLTAKGAETNSKELQKYYSVVGQEVMQAERFANDKPVEIKKGNVSMVNKEDVAKYFKGLEEHIKMAEMPKSASDKTYSENFNMAYELGQALAKMGIKVKLYASDQSFDVSNGMYADDIVFVDVNAGYSGAKAAVGQAFSHELTHWLKAHNEEGYQRLLKFVREDMGEKVFNDLVAKEKDKANAEEDVVADACAKMLGKSETFRRYAVADQKGARAILNRLLHFIKTLRNAYKEGLNKTATDIIRDYEGLYRIWEAEFQTALKMASPSETVSAQAAVGLIENKPQVAENIVGTELVTQDSKKSSQRMNAELMAAAKKEWEKHGRELGIDYQTFYRATALCNMVAHRLLTDLAPYLPEDNPGKVEVGNLSYGLSMENALVCIRSIINNDFTDMVSEELGRPLTVEEQLVASQVLQIINERPECNYCYVATDRRAYRAFFGTYFDRYESVFNKVKKNRDTYRNEIKGAENKLKEINVEKGEKNYGDTPLSKLYAEFLKDKKNTAPQRKRFIRFVNDALNGDSMAITKKDLASARMRDLAVQDANKKWIVEDAVKYAKGASYAKLTSRVIKINGKNYVADYVSYNGSILKWKDTLIQTLNSEFGLRMYSFSDYVPAFLLENMQMIMDASLRGLKVLAYTKDCGFAEAFADTGAGINISLFGTLDKKANKDTELARLRDKYKETNSDADRKAYLAALDKYVVRDGIGGKDGMMGANWERASALRKSYKNVGTVFVATNDDLVEWALANPEIDVVIPYHLVKTGEEVAAFFDYKNYKAHQADKKKEGWAAPNLKEIPPTLHENDFATYKDQLDKNNLDFRFKDFKDNPNYMKLVNETRMSYKDMSPVKPVFNESVIMRELGRIKQEGEYGTIPGFATKAEQDAFIENQNLVGQAVDAIGEWNESGKKPIDDTKYSFRDQVSIGMSDSDREAILRNKTLKVYEYNGESDAEISSNLSKLNSQKKQTVEKALRNIGETFDIFKNYKNEDFEIEIFLSKGTLGESVTQGIKDAKQIAKLMPKISDAISNAIGLRVGISRYYRDTSTVDFVDLLGGYIEGDLFFPIRFGVKRSSAGENSIRVIIDSDGIKKDKVIGTNITQSQNQASQSLPTRLSNISLPELFRNVKDDSLLRYIPDGFLDAQQIAAKYAAIARTIKRTNDKNDLHYREFIAANNMNAARAMVKKAAKINGFELSKSGKTAILKSDPSISESAETIIYDQNGDIVPISERFVSNVIRFASRNTDSRDSQGRELSPAQQEYFKDSKVRDEDGNLKVMYHGTDADLNFFDKKKIGQNYELSEGGFFFTSSQKQAKAYGSNVIPVYLNIQNPLVVDAPALVSPTDFYDSQDLMGEAHSNGNDGIIVNGTGEYSGKTLAVALESNQAKRVDNLNPTNDEDIRYSVRELDDGTKYVYLDGDRFLRDDGSEMNEKEAYDTLVGKTITLPDGDNVTFVKELPGKKMYKELFHRFPFFKGVKDKKGLNKTINQNIVEAYQTSHAISRNVDDRNNEHEEYGIDTFDTREVIIADDNKAYTLELTVANLEDGSKIAYAKKSAEVNPQMWAKIKKEGVADNSRFSQPSTQNIPQSSTDVNTPKDGVASYTEERVDRLLRQYGSKSNPKYSQAYATYISPDDFLALTTNDARQIENDSRELNEEELRNNTQEIFLKIENENGKMVVYGHEGRHRMVALRNHGINSVAISVIDLTNKYTKEIEDSLVVSKQNFTEDNWNDFEADTERKVTLSDLIPISYENEEMLKEFFVNKDNQVRYSTRDSEYMDALKRHDYEKMDRIIKQTAEDNGYIPVIRFHQTGETFTKFNTDNPQAGALDSETPNGIFLKTNDHDIGVGGDYVKTGKGGNIQMPLYIKSDNMLHFKNREEAAKWYKENVPGYKEISDEWARVYDEKYKPQFDELEKEQFNPDTTDERQEELDAIETKLIEELGKEENKYRKQMRDLLDEYFLNGNSEYDGIELEDDGHRYINGKREDVHTFIVFYPTQVKSADIITRDDNGDIIPPSQRFNTEETDIRFSYRELANSESEMIVNALSDYEALADGVTKQSIAAYAKAYGELQTMERQSIAYDKALAKASPSEREAILRKIVRLDRAILKKTTELTEMRTQRVLRDVIVNEWNKRLEDVAWTNELTYQKTKKALEQRYGTEIRDIRQKAKDEKREIRERHEINKRKKNIEAKTKELMNRILHGTEKKHIPSILVNPIVEMLDSIDYWTPKEGRPITKKSETMRERFVNFREAINNYQKQIDEGAELTEYMFDPDFLDEVEELCASVKGIDNVNDMSVQDIINLDHVLTELNHLISRGNKMIVASHYATINDAVNETTQELLKRDDVKKTAGSLRTRLNAGMSDTYAFGKYAGQGANNIVDMLSKAFEQKILQIKEGKEFADKVLKGKDTKGWSKKKYDFEVSSVDENGKQNKVSLTVAQMMELYLLNKREQARGHIYGGGINVQDKNGKFAKAVKVTEEDVSKIIQFLKTIPGAIEVADELQKFGATTVTGWGNKASNLLYGISKFTEPDYWQIRSDSASLKDTKDSEAQANASMYKLQNLGRTKAVKKGANNALYIGDVFDTYAKTIDEMSSYSSILPATTDAMRWYNSSVAIDDEHRMRVKEILANKLGTDMAKVFTDSIKALNGGILGTDSLESLVKKLTGKAKAAAVAGNLRVVLQQPTAYTRAFSVIPAKYLLKALTMRPASAEAQEHSAIAWHKAQGFYSNGLAPSLRKLIVGDSTIGESITEKALWLAGKADDITWGALWNASKLMVEDTTNLKKGSDEYWEAVNKIFSNIINQTQVVDTPLTRSTWMRGNGVGIYFTAFMAEPTKTFSMVSTAMDKFLQNPHSKEAQKALKVAAFTFGLNAFVNALAQAIADAARDDDKEKDYWQKYQEQFGEDVLDNLNPLTYVPVVKDAWSAINGYSSSRLDLQAVQNSVYAMNEIKKIANGTSKKTLFGQAEQISKAVSSWTGIPVSNVMRTLNSAGNVMGIDLFRRKKYTNTELGRNIVLSTNEGDYEAADKYMAELTENCKGDMDKVNNYVVNYLADHDDTIDKWAAAYMDDPTALDTAIVDMSDKYSPEIITKAIRKSINNDAESDDEKIKTNTLSDTIYTSDDINRMIEKGDIETAQEIINQVNEGYSNNGSKTTAKNVITTYWKPIYIKASMSEKEEIRKKLYKLQNNGKQMYSSKDFDNWK